MRSLFLLLFVLNQLFVIAQDSVYLSYKVDNGKIEIGNLWDAGGNKVSLRVLKSSASSFNLSINRTSVAELWLSNNKDFRLVILPLVRDDSILVTVDRTAINIRYLNSEKAYRRRETVLKNFLSICTTLPVISNEQTKAKLNRGMDSRWDCLASVIASVGTELEKNDSLTAEFLVLYDVYRLVNEEMAFLRSTTKDERVKRIHNGNWQTVFKLIVSLNLADNVLLANSLQTYFTYLDDIGLPPPIFEQAVRNIDQMWPAGKAKSNFFKRLINSPHISAGSVAAIEVVTSLLPAVAEMNRSKISSNLAYPEKQPSLQDSVVFENGEKSTLDAILTDTSSALKLVDFWASWCMPCRKAYLATEAKRKRIKDRGIRIVYLSTDLSEKSWLIASETEKLANTGTSIRLTDPKAAQVNRLLSLNTIPRYVLFDRHGALVNSNMPGFEDQSLESLLTNYLKKTGNKR